MRILSQPIGQRRFREYAAASANMPPHQGAWGIVQHPRFRDGLLSFVSGALTALAGSLPAVNAEENRTPPAVLLFMATITFTASFMVRRTAHVRAPASTTHAPPDGQPPSGRPRVVHVLAEQNIAEPAYMVDPLPSSLIAMLMLPLLNRSCPTGSTVASAAGSVPRLASCCFAEGSAHCSALAWERF